MMLFISLLLLGTLPYIGIMSIFGYFITKKKMTFKETFFLTIPINLLFSIGTGFAIGLLDNQYDFLNGDEKMAAFIIPIFLFILNFLLTMIIQKYYSFNMKKDKKLKLLDI